MHFLLQFFFSTIFFGNCFAAASDEFYLKLDEESQKAMTELYSEDVFF